MKFTDYLKDHIILFDGAMGTEIQKLQIDNRVWGDYPGCNEILSLNAPEHIAGIHRAYLEAGADVIETNTFGANRIVLSEYDLEERTREINREAAKLAVSARDTYAAENSPGRPLFVAGSMGPGTKLPTLGQVDFDTIHRSYFDQACGLIEGGIDLFIIETCQDILQVKAAVIAAKDALHETGGCLPIIVSVTVESNGNLLVGTDIPAAVTAVTPLGVDIIGINCATGPAEMRPHLEELSNCFSGRLFCMPNAGFPVQKNGKLVYDLPAGDFADLLISFVREYGVQIIGGCCGSDPSFIAELRGRISEFDQDELRRIESKRQSKSFSIGKRKGTLSSLYSSKELRQEPPPFFVGERINSNGSKKFREYLFEENWDAIVTMGREQQKTGAHGLDICTAYAGRNELEDMKQIIGRLVTQIDLPLVIDSTNPEVLETSLRLVGGRALINSVNLENGEEAAGRIFTLASRYGAAVIALTIDEEGMARTVERKLAIARRILRLAVETYGLQASDIVIDPLTFTLGSGDPELRDAGANTIEALKMIKKELPGVHTILGVSNISFGLSPVSREVLNSLFLAESVKAGLDLAIVNVRKIIPLFQIPSSEKELALNLIYNRGSSDPLLSYIGNFDGKSQNGSGSKENQAEVRTALSPEEELQELVLDGTSAGLTEALNQLVKTRQASSIISEVLIPAMKKVGKLFGEGSLQLPFVLQSAEVMKKAVDHLEPYLEHHGNGPGKKIVLATVRGDVHDIGKNLVDIILSNNGYQVINLGIKVDIETIIEKVLEIDADAVGLSGLLVKSTSIMKMNLEEMRRRGIHIPVLLGGAALTEKFVRQECAPILKAPVYYCRDAFDGLHALENADTRSAVQIPEESAQIDPASEVQKKEAYVPDRRSYASDFVPEPPSFNLERLENIDLKDLFEHINRSRLFRSRWKYRRGAASESEYQALEREELIPLFEKLKTQLIDRSILTPQASYRFFPCRSKADELILFDHAARNEISRFGFARQKKAPFTAVSDFFLPEQAEKDDITALQIVTLGTSIGEEIHRTFMDNNYRDYLHLHGLAVELTEALADYTQIALEKTLGIQAEAEPLGIFKGTRYSFGYPCCPELSTNRIIADLLKADTLGIGFSGDDQMVPEFSTSGFVCFNPKAEYI